MKYQKIWDKVINPKNGEKIQCEFSISDTFRMIGIIAGILWGLLFMIWNWIAAIAILLLAFFHFGYYLKVAHSYAFTNKRVLIHQGWLSTKVVSVDYKKITDVTVQESFFARIFYKAGDLVINTAGSSDKEIILKNISSPYELLKTLDGLRKNS